MSIINISKPTTSLSNQNKVSVGETWTSILTSWTTETRTWQAVSQLITDMTRQSSSITNVAKP
jgi:hypothetical protein